MSLQVCRFQQQLFFSPEKNTFSCTATAGENVTGSLFVSSTDSDDDHRNKNMAMMAYHPFSVHGNDTSNAGFMGLFQQIITED